MPQPPRLTPCLPAFLIAASLVAPASQAGPNIKLSGWVWGMQPGDAVTLVIQGPVQRQINAKPGGAWVADGLPAGEYQVVPRSPGYSFQPPARSVKPGTGGLSSVNFQATSGAAAAQAGFAIRGWVRGLPAGERVLVRAEGPGRAEVMTQPGGLYVLAGLVPGTYQVEVVDTRYQAKPAGRTVKVGQADRTNIHFTAKRRPQAAKRDLPPAHQPKPTQRHNLSGRVEGLKALLHGCTQGVVTATGAGQTHRVKTMVSEDVRLCGRFSFRDLPADTYQIAVHVQGYGLTRYESRPASRKIQVRADVDGIVFEVEQRSIPRRKRRGL